MIASSAMTPTECYMLFETAIGTCGLAWSGSGLTRLQLPEANRAATESRLRRQAAPVYPGEVPVAVPRAIAALQRYFAGEAPDLAALPLDLARLPPFHQRVYEVLRAVGRGETVTYGTLAERVGSPGSARAVGAAMGANPLPVIIPCHRVLASGGKAGGFSAFGGLTTKARLLALEGRRLVPAAPLLEIMTGR